MRTPVLQTQTRRNEGPRCDQQRGDRDEDGHGRPPGRALRCPDHFFLTVGFPLVRYAVSKLVCIAKVAFDRVLIVADEVTMRKPITQFLNGVNFSPERKASMFDRLAPFAGPSVNISGVLPIWIIGCHSRNPNTGMPKYD